MSRGLAIKRHHDSRIKTKTKQILERLWVIDEEVSASEIGRCASVHCSCGNPGKHFGKRTRKEKEILMVDISC